MKSTAKRVALPCGNWDMLRCPPGEELQRFAPYDEFSEPASGPMRRTGHDTSAAEMVSLGFC